MNEFKDISNRGRVAFAICCLENAVSFYNQNQKPWAIVLKQLWDFCNGNMAFWQERTSEFTPFVVLDEVDFAIKDYRYISEAEHDVLKELYKESNETILQILDLIYEIGITNVYIPLNTEALKVESLSYLQQVIDLMNQNNIPLPNIELFRKFTINENNGWGREFSRDEIYNDDNTPAKG